MSLTRDNRATLEMDQKSNMNFSYFYNAVWNCAPPVFILFDNPSWAISNQIDFKNRKYLFNPPLKSDRMNDQKMIHTHLGTIPLLRQHIFGLFMTHPLCHHNYSTECQQKLTFSYATLPVLLLT